ncbi:MAG TPA: hypothetical protein VKR52_18735 [Terracidiphilus sp.]|nr:hypothetical protein [Terracidiphilus sp.]
MRRFVWVPVCFVALLVPVVVLASGAEGGFNDVVNTIESRYHVHATRIPFLGLISLVASRSTHEGVSSIHIAEFEHFSADVDGNELNKMVEERLGAGWERMIRETCRHGNEQTLIFSRPEGKHMGLFVLDLDGHDLDVVQVSVDPDHLSQTIGKYSHHDHEKSDDDGDTSD